MLSIKKLLSLAMGMVLLTGCGAYSGLREPVENSTEAPTQTFNLPITALDVKPETFEVGLKVGDKTLQLSKPIQAQRVSGCVKTDKSAKWLYPDKQIEVTLSCQSNYLEVNMRSLKKQAAAMSWPRIEGREYWLPLGEGKHVEANNVNWQKYLGGESLSAIEQLSMPFWANENKGLALLWVMDKPERETLDFNKNTPIAFDCTHTFSELEANPKTQLRLYVTPNTPVAVAKTYKQDLQRRHEFVSLKEKALENPNVEKLYGAAHLYLANDRVIGPSDIHWQAFIKASQSAQMAAFMKQAETLETSGAYKAVIKALGHQNYVDAYQKQVICAYLSEWLRQKNEKNALAGENFIASNSQALYQKFEGVFNPVQTWIQTDTVDLVKDIKASGITQAWLGLHSWEQAFSKPQMMTTAMAEGYLIGPYDSYHSIHEPGHAKWITADFEDASLYERASIKNKAGVYLTGFQNTGRKLNPTLSLPAVQSRVNGLLASGLNSNSWFIDCDATGEIFDDYSPEHVTTKTQDMAARLERIRWIKSKQMVVGSEGGHDFAAKDIAFAHGIELPSFSWMDDDMKKNAQSPYYMGKYYSAKGGVPDHFSKRVPLKPYYEAIFADPSMDVPLFKLVYNDSLITTYHWDWSTFKIQGDVKNRMLREVLYNVPPLMHLDTEQWKRYKHDFVNHYQIWQGFSRAVINSEMTDFKNLKSDGSVQLCQYGTKNWVVANFSTKSFRYLNYEIPSKALLMQKQGKISIYQPNPKFE